MAIPTMTNNSPSAGSIAWGSFSIQLNGVVYSVAAGSTNQRWVWWKFNGGAPVITAGPEVPNTLVDDDLVLFANKNGIGARVQSSSFVDGELLVDGSIFADALSTNLINSEHIVTAGLDAGVVKFGTMSGDRIAVNTLQGDRILANSIVVSKLAVSDWENYVPDPYFEKNRWVLGAGVAVAAIADMPLGIGAGNVARFTGGGTREAWSTDQFDVSPADVLRSAIWVRKLTNTASPVGSVALRVRHFNAAGQNLTPFFLGVALANSAMAQNQWYELVIDPGVLPQGQRTARVDFLTIGVNAADNFEFAIPQVNKKQNGRLVIDGTLLATSIKAGDITALQLGAGSVTAAKIAAKAVDASRLNISDLTNYAVDGDFRDPDSANWDMLSQGRLARFNPAGDFPYMELSTATAQSTFLKNLNVFEAYFGDEYFITCEVSTPSTNTNTLTFRAGLELQNHSGASLLWRTLPDFSLPPNTPWTEVSGSVLMDATDVASAWFNPIVNQSTTANQKVRVRRIMVRKRRGGELLVDGTIQARHLEIDTVAAAIINTKILQSQLTITGNLTIAGSDMGWSKAEGLYLGSGVVFYDDSRTNRVEGDLVTESLSVKDGLSIGGNADVRGTVVVSNGINTPTAKMSLSGTWPKTLSAALSEESGTKDMSSVYQDLLDYDATRWLTSVNFFGGGFRLVNKSDGSWAGDLTAGSWKTNFYPNGGLCRIGTNLYVLGSDSTRSGNHYIYQINSAGNKTAERYIVGLTGFGNKRVRLITDGTNVGMIWSTVSNGTLMLRWFNAALTATVGSDITLLAGVGNSNVGGAHWGIGQSGGTARIWVSMHTDDSNMVRCWTTAGVRVAAEDFPRAANSSVSGLSYDSALGRMVSFDKYGNLYRYSLYVNGGTLNGQYTYYDGDNAVYPAGTVINGVDRSGQASGAHETSPSPVTSYALPKRAWPVVTAPPAPDELVTDVTQVDKADRLGIYVSLGGTPVLQSYLAKGVRSLPVTDQLATSGTLAGASTVPSFASASVPSPGKFRSSGQSLGSSTWELPGSGDGRMGPLRWDVNSRPLNHGEWISSTAQTCAVNTWTKRTGFVERIASSPSHGITYNTSTGDFTLSQAGLYLVSGALIWPSTLAAGRRISSVWEGGTIRFRTDLMSKAANDWITPTVNGVLWFPAGAVLSLQGYQTTAATTFESATVGGTFFSITCLAAY